MKKSLWILLFVVLICVIPLSSCDANMDSSSNDDHEQSTQQASNDNNSTKCQHIEVIDPAVAATCTTDGKTEGKHCSLCGEILVAQTVIEASHTDGKWIIDADATSTEDGRKHQICSICNEVMQESVIPATGSLGLEYYYENGGYVVQRYTQSETDILIPEQYDDCVNGYANVIGIAKYAFSQSDVISVSLPDSLIYIDDGAFKECSMLSKINLNEGLEKIGNECFRYCEKITSIEIPASVSYIGDRAFESTGVVTLDIKTTHATMGAWVFLWCEDLTTITIADGTKTLYHGQFEGCDKLETVMLPETIEEIGYDAFMDCESLRQINIPKSVTRIKDWAFYGCSNELIVSYSGTAAQWRAIDIGTNNDVLYQCQINYQSE